MEWKAVGTWQNEPFEEASRQVVIQKSTFERNYELADY